MQGEKSCISLRTVTLVIATLFSGHREVCGFIVPPRKVIQTTQSSAFSYKHSRNIQSAKNFVLKSSISADGQDNDDVLDVSDNKKEKAVAAAINKDGNSKREMLSFAIPALGIFISSPLLSNIDNAFVGRTVGVSGLAALSPATFCIDQMLYLFSFLSRATTGIVARAYSKPISEKDIENKVDANIIGAQQAASAPLSVALISGLALVIVYAFLTPAMLCKLNVDPSLHSEAAKYIYWRGSISWAALTQSVSLSVLLATRDAISPLKIIGLAAVVNVIGDWLLCVYPLQLGCAGASAATAFATLFSSFFMIKTLAKKKLLPKLAVPSRRELKELFDYVGPLFAITISRLLGFMSMQKAAIRCGVQNLASYQICINCMIFFLLFGEPLSQLHQTKLPALIDSEDRSSTFSTMKSVLSLASFAALGVSATAFFALTFGSGLFTSDQAVRSLIVKTAPSVSTAIASAIMAIAIDGAMLASRDFSFILVLGIFTCILQVILSSQCTSLNLIFFSFALRLFLYSLAAFGRIGMGFGTLGKLFKNK
jgi:Na+-driven multidrug efflux pump